MSRAARRTLTAASGEPHRCPLPLAAFTWALEIGSRLIPSKKSAGLLLYREKSGIVEVFLVHPGGPFWAKKDDGAWSIPKGQLEEGEDPLAAAKREFREETGLAAEGEYLPLAPVRQNGGKLVYAWAVRGDLDAALVQSNTFSIEWPPRSGKMREFPEVDRAAWFALDLARRKILKSQLPLLDGIELLVTGRLDCGETG